jgi:hypothetical protein
VLPRVAAPADLGASLAASDALQGGDALAAVTWLQRAAHVRDGAARLESALMYAQAVGSPERLNLRIAQLPHRPGDRWVGLSAPADQPVPGGRLSLVVQSGPPPGPTVAGLVVDEWTEVVPHATQMTGLSFHVDQPTARAPQVVLLAVPPTEQRVWSLDALEAAVLETLDLARMRLVDLAGLGQPSETAPPPSAFAAGAAARLGHYLPAVYLADAPAEQTVTTDLGPLTGTS